MPTVAVLTLMCGSCLITHVWFYNSCARYNNKGSCLFQRSIYCEFHVLQRGGIASGRWLSIVFVPSSNPFQCANAFRDTVLLILSVSLLDGVVECLFFNVTITLKGDGDDDNDTRINPLLQYGGHQEPSSIDPSLQNNTRVVVLWPCNVHATWAISPPCHYH